MSSSASLSSVGIATAMPLSSASHRTTYPPSFVCQNTTCQRTDGKHKGHREAARIGTGELPSSNGEAQTHGACPALRPAPRHRHMRARCLLYACRISRSAVPPPDARLTGRRFSERKILPAFLHCQDAGTRFGIIVPHPLFNLYHFCIYVNDFLSAFFHSPIKMIFLTRPKIPLQQSILFQLNPF